MVNVCPRWRSRRFEPVVVCRAAPSPAAWNVRLGCRSCSLRASAISICGRRGHWPSAWSRSSVSCARAGMYHYAQKHPAEDWAETFAVWLDPDTHWRRRYREWQVAFAKLEYVDRIVELEGACRGSPSNVRLGLRVSYTDMRETVAEYF